MFSYVAWSALGVGLLSSGFLLTKISFGAGALRQMAKGALALLIPLVMAKGAYESGVPLLQATKRKVYLDTRPNYRKY